MARPERLLAVGWLERGHRYPRRWLGAAPLDVLNALVGLATRFTPVLLMGAHACSLCGGASGSSDVFVADVVDPLALWVAPALIVHYVEVHRYRPPRRFLASARAALAAPGTDYEDACNARWSMMRG